MLPSQLDSSRPILDLFDDLGGYEKGALARALIKGLIKQGSLEILPEDQNPGRISISIEGWQLELLARFSDDGETEEAEDEKEILLDKLCQLR